MEIYANRKTPAAECCTPAPPVLEFDEEGNLIGHWAARAPVTIGPIRIMALPWITKATSGSAAIVAARIPKGYRDNMVLKFTQSGKFLMQIGHPGKSQGSNDTENLKGPAKLFVDGATDELYVADGYGNHRVDRLWTRKPESNKRHWGAYGKKPDDTTRPYNPDAPPAQHFRNRRALRPSFPTTASSMSATARTTQFQVFRKMAPSQEASSPTKTR